MIFLCVQSCSSRDCYQLLLLLPLLHPPTPTSHTYFSSSAFFVILPTSVTQQSSLGWSETKGLLCSHSLCHSAARSPVSGDNKTSPPSQGDCKAQIHPLTHSSPIHPFIQPLQCLSCQARHWLQGARPCLRLTQPLLLWNSEG